MFQRKIVQRITFWRLRLKERWTCASLLHLQGSVSSRSQAKTAKKRFFSSRPKNGSFFGVSSFFKLLQLIVENTKWKILTSSPTLDCQNLFLLVKSCSQFYNLLTVNFKLVWKAILSQNKWDRKTPSSIPFQV